MAGDKSSPQVTTGVFVTRVSLRASGESMCTKEKSTGEGFVVELVASIWHHCSSRIRRLCCLCPLSEAVSTTACSMSAGPLQVLWHSGYRLNTLFSQLREFMFPPGDNRAIFDGL